jgi:hypothetical protein
MQMPPTLDHQGLEISGFDQIGGPVSPSDFMSMIGDLFPIALCGGLVARSLSRLISVVACSVEDALDAAQVQR